VDTPSTPFSATSPYEISFTPTATLSTQSVSVTTPKGSQVEYEYIPTPSGVETVTYTYAPPVDGYETITATVPT
jgi:hypothetical protein